MGRTWRDAGFSICFHPFRWNWLLDVDRFGRYVHIEAGPLSLSVGW